MTNDPTRATGEQGTGAAAGTAADQLLDSVREAAGRAFTVVGHLGPNAHGVPAFLASDPTTGELTILLLQAESGPGEEEAFGLVEIRTLDAAAPTFGARCHTCDAPLPNWEPQCPVCRADAAGVVSDADHSPPFLLEIVRALAGDEVEVLGAMRREVGGGEVYFARRRGANQLSVVRLVRDEPSGYALDSGAIVASYEGSSGRGGSGASSAGGTAGRPIPVASPPDPDVKVCPHCGAVFGQDVRFCPNDGSTLRSKSGDKGLIGQILADRYHVSKKLGEGGMGEVYLAEQFKIGRLCAIKVMRTMLMDDADAAARFNAEASNACRINHGNVAAIYDFGEATGGIVYLAMEYIDGEPLSQTLAREVRLAADRVAVIGYQTADALSAAHELGIIHRDLKPDNVMVARGRDERDLIKVVDFGIAKAIRTDGRGVTRTGFVLGTPAYMSPEQVTGESLDGRSDVYSLGCILFECLTGRLPFEKGAGAGGGGVQLTRRLAEAPPHPREIDRSIPKAMDAIVVKALARAREDRYDSAATLRDALAMQFAGSRRALLGFGGGGFGLGGRPAPARPVAPAPTPAPTVPPQQATPDMARLRIRAAVTRARPAAPIPSPAAPKSPHVARPSLSTTRRASRDTAAITDPVPATVAIAPRVRGSERGKSSGRGRRVATVVTGLVAASAVVLLVARPWAHRTGTVPAPVASPVRQPDAVAQRAPDSVAAAAANFSGAPSADARPAPPATPAPSSGAPPRGDSAAVRASFVRAFRQAAAAAAASRAMASASGATAAEFRVGDSVRRAADVAAAVPDRERALADLVVARQYWDRVTRAASGRAAAARPSGVPAAPSGGAVVGATPTPSQAASSSVVSPNPSPAGAQPGPPPPAVAVAPSPVPPAASSTAAPRPVPASGAASPSSPAFPADDAAARSRAATDVVAAYVAALNDRDLAQMKQRYPTMSAASQNGFADLFANATDFSAHVVTLPAAVVSGNTADVIVSYSIDYYLSSQGRKHVATRLHAVLKQTADGWRIESLTPAN